MRAAEQRAQQTIYQQVLHPSWSDIVMQYTALSVVQHNKQQSITSGTAQRNTARDPLDVVIYYCIDTLCYL